MSTRNQTDGVLAAEARALVRQLMEKTGATQTVLAERMGVGEAVVRRALADGSNPTLATIERMITALGGSATIHLQ